MSADIRVHFVGAGPGAEDLITLRGMRLLEKTDVVIYAGSLVNPALLSYAGDAQVYNSAVMTLDEVIGVIRESYDKGLDVVRLHTGDQSIYGAVKEQMQMLDELGIAYDSCPGVSAAFGAAASMDIEYTLPGISQSLIITRMEGRTPVPEKESIRSLASHGASMAVYLSASMTGRLSAELIAGGYDPETPAAIVYKATWPEEKCISCTVGSLEKAAEENGIKKTAVILVGEAVSPEAFDKSKLYDPEFTTGFRKGTKA